MKRDLRKKAVKGQGGEQLQVVTVPPIPDAQPPALRLFVKAMLSEWGSRLSGSASVPFTILALWASSTVQKVAYGTLAVALGAYSAYQVWKREYDGKQAAIAEIAALKQTYFGARPRLAMHISYLSDSVIDGRHNVEFRLRLLSGRTPSSLSMQPVYSRRGSYSIRFQPLSFLTADHEQTVDFEVWRSDAAPSRKARALRSGWGDMLAEFVGESLGEGWGIETSPVIVTFRDGDDYQEQRFRLTFDPNTRKLGVVDDLPEKVF